MYQVVRTLLNWFPGRKKNADKRMICHEFTMTVWDAVRGIFPDCYKGNIADIYHSKEFKHI